MTACTVVCCSMISRARPGRDRTCGPAWRARADRAARRSYQSSSAPMLSGPASGNNCCFWPQMACARLPARHESLPYVKPRAICWIPVWSPPRDRLDPHPYCPQRRAPREAVSFTRRRPGMLFGAKTVGSFLPGLTRKAFEKYGFSAATLITDWARHRRAPSLRTYGARAPEMATPGRSRRGRGRNRRRRVGPAPPWCCASTGRVR